MKECQTCDRKVDDSHCEECHVNLCEENHLIGCDYYEDFSEKFR